MGEEPTTFRVERITSQHGVGAFDCGEPSLNDYLMRHALENTLRRLAVTYVAVRPDSHQIIGYYTLSSAQVRPEQLPGPAGHGLPAYPTPVILIGRLAVDRSASGKGLGGGILVDALRRSFALSSSLGAYCVVVDALNEEIKSWYERFGFRPTVDQPRRLFLRMKKIASLLDQ